MVSTTTIIMCTLSLLLCLVMPVVLIILFAKKNKGQKLISAWILGAAGFFVTQILIRVPILSVLSTQPWFLTFSQNHTFAYAFTLAFTAGLFELAGRFVVAQLMKKNLTFKRSIAAGLGHGGIEAMLLVGSSYITNLVFIFMINTGSFNSLLSEAASAGVDPAQLNAIADSLINSSPALFLLGGYERILAMIAHLAMSLIVCYSVSISKPLPGALICLVIHTFIDLSAGINMLAGTIITQNTAYLIIYTILTAVAAVSLWIIRKIYGYWSNKEVSHESETA